MDQELDTIEVGTAINREGVTFAIAKRARRSFPLALLKQITMHDGCSGETILANEVMLFEVVNLLVGYSAWEAAKFVEVKTRPEPDYVHAIVKGPGPHPTIEELIDKSSLGTPKAKAARARTSPEVAKKIVKRANSLAAFSRALDDKPGPANAYHVGTQFGKLRAVRMIMSSLNAVAEEFEVHGRKLHGPQTIENAHYLRGVNDGFKQAAQVLRDAVGQLGRLF
jgi:hypothetical protein